MVSRSISGSFARDRRALVTSPMDPVPQDALAAVSAVSAATDTGGPVGRVPPLGPSQGLSRRHGAVLAPALAATCWAVQL
jgi:hypothetical protein